MEEKYADILHRPRPVSSRRAPMSNHDRAAQFAPFAALTGLDAAMAETARSTDAPIELDESEKMLLNEKLRKLLPVLHTHPMVTITHFQPDTRKKGGAYVCTTGRIKHIEEYSQTIRLTNGCTIPLEYVLAIELP